VRIKTPTVGLTSVVKLAAHTAMGIAMGLTFSLVLTISDLSGITTLINHSATPGTTLTMFVDTIVLTFGIGATLTGLVFTMMEDS
jgi:hypothetical protein